MPRFHFNVHDGEDFSDDLGMELADIATVRQHALKYSGDLLKDQTEKF